MAGGSPTGRPPGSAAASTPLPASLEEAEAVESSDDDDGPTSLEEGRAAIGASLSHRAPLQPPANLRIELIADGLQLPANITFAPDGRIFLTEVSAGRVRVVDRGRLLPEPFAQVNPAPRPQMGLLGLALDPDFALNHYVYLFYSDGTSRNPSRNRVVRFKDLAGRGTDMQVVLDHLPIGKKHWSGRHNGGRLGFGPDGALYVTVGDAEEPGLVQAKEALAGKVLRVTRDGSVPADNPYPDSPVYALGLRNPWGLAFDPVSGPPYVADNGPNGHDEINRIEPGGNYGWPEQTGVHKSQRFVDPVWDSGGERGAVTGLTFYTGDLFPEYKNDLLFCAFANGHLTRLRLGGDDHTRVDAEQVLSDQCHLDVVTGPDGAIYISSVNKIQRLLPPG